MVKAKDKVYDAAENVKPYVERAISDEKLRQDVLSAFATARELYNEIVGSRSAVTIASRVATDEEIREKLKSAVDDLRSATDRLQGREEQTNRHTGLLLVGFALGILFNPWTGPETRRWLKELVSGSDDEFGGDYPPPAVNGGATIPD
jgi:gas vesicle protein